MYVCMYVCVCVHVCMYVYVYVYVYVHVCVCVHVCMCIYIHDHWSVRVLGTHGVSSLHPSDVCARVTSGAQLPYKGWVGFRKSNGLCVRASIHRTTHIHLP